MGIRSGCSNPAFEQGRNSTGRRVVTLKTMMMPNQRNIRNILDGRVLGRGNNKNPTCRRVVTEITTDSDLRRRYLVLCLPPILFHVSPPLRCADRWPSVFVSLLGFNPGFEVSASLLSTVSMGHVLLVVRSGQSWGIPAFKASVRGTAYAFFLLSPSASTDFGGHSQLCTQSSNC
jgi:hypothetical protein